jgi:hypothetical protein
MLTLGGAALCGHRHDGAVPWPSGRAHFLLDPLNRSSPQPKRLGDLQDAYPLLELLLCFAFKGDVDLRSSQPRTLCDSTLKPRLDPLSDHRPLEFRKGTGDSEHELPHWRGRIDSLLIQVQVDANRLKVLDGAQQVDQRSSEPVDCPGHGHIELPAARFLKQEIKAGPIGATFRATDTGIVVSTTSQPRRSATWRSSRSWFSMVWLSVLTLV